jgi:hypothetical protein
MGGIFLLALAGYNFATFTVTSSQQSTFNIPSGSAEYLSKTEYPGNSVSGTFLETAGDLVSYYIMNSAQFASFQSGTSLSSVYSIENVASASVSYGFTAQDDYYFVFRHGTGLLNTTETVSYQRYVHITRQFPTLPRNPLLDLRSGRDCDRFSTPKSINAGGSSSSIRAADTTSLWGHSAESSQALQESR